jgi:hypothetical protein
MELIERKCRPSHWTQGKEVVVLDPIAKKVPVTVRSTGNFDEARTRKEATW